METILILHGWGGSSKSWLKVGDILEKQSCKVFKLDLPGFGFTPEPSQPWSVGNYTDWVNDFFEKNNLQHVFLLGHSFGGRIAAKFAVKYPGKLKGLILVDAAGIARENTMGLKQKIILKLAKSRYFIITFPLLGKLIYPFLQKLSYFLAGTRDYYLIKSNVMKETFKKTIDEDLSPYFCKITTPSLVVWGAKDIIIPAKFAYAINEQIRGSVLEIIPGVGHNPHLESPEILADKIIKFITN